MPFFSPRVLDIDERPREYIDTHRDVACRFGLLSFVGSLAGAVGGSLSAAALKTCSVGAGALFGTFAAAAAFPIYNELSNTIDRKVYEYICYPTAKHKRLIKIGSAVGGYFAGTALGYGVCKAAGVEMNFLPEAMSMGALSVDLGAASLAVGTIGFLLLKDCISCICNCVQTCINEVNRPEPLQPEGDGGPIPVRRAVPRLEIVRNPHRPAVIPPILDQPEGPGGIEQPRPQLPDIGEFHIEAGIHDDPPPVADLHLEMEG